MICSVDCQTPLFYTLSYVVGEASSLSALKIVYLNIVYEVMMTIRENLVIKDYNCWTFHRANTINVQ
jgi:hypothetical protein